MTALRLPLLSRWMVFEFRIERTNAAPVLDLEKVYKRQQQSLETSRRESDWESRKVYAGSPLIR